ncbi:hypothetical protein [Citrobacter amalonaticus]|uniref:hypothetical protein n=1 Tax=Citrobacter amalonaticus TaxID=35703 RepID=UPI000F6859EB|nr:hypothetical protein [Citrobacter amalonaticus]RSC52170.1 hypothetical protein EGW07_24550 [Citrobacter amalonaticus]
MLRLWFFIPDVFVVVQNGEVRGPRVSVEVLLDSERRGLAAASEGLFVLFTVVSEIKTFPAAKQRRD